MDFFGAPGTGIHSYRFKDLAIVDVIFTVAAGILVSQLTKVPVYITTLVLFILGIILHRIFNVRTTIDKKLFPNVL
jgi:hypothetical protein